MARLHSVDMLRVDMLSLTIYADLEVLVLLETGCARCVIYFQIETVDPCGVGGSSHGCGAGACTVTRDTRVALWRWCLIAVDF